MDFSCANAIRASTKPQAPPSDSRGRLATATATATATALPGASPGGGHATDHLIRRDTSSSSLDVAATVFSSMRELEASVRNLNSLSGLGGSLPGTDGCGGGAGGFLSTLDGARLGGLRSSLGGLGTAGRSSSLDLMGGGGYGGHHGQNALLGAHVAHRDRFTFLDAAQDAATPIVPGRFFATSNLRAAGGGRLPPQAALEAQALELWRLEIEGLLLQQRQQRQRLEQNFQQQFLGNPSGSYPTLPPTLAGLTSSQLLQEVSRWMPRTSIRSESREASDSASTVPTSPAASSKATPQKMTNSGEPSGAADAPVADITINADKPSIGSREKDKTPAGRTRNNSATSFDALLSVFGDEIAEQEREKNSESISLATSPGVGSYSNNNNNNNNNNSNSNTNNTNNNKASTSNGSVGLVGSGRETIAAGAHTSSSLSDHRSASKKSNTTPLAVARMSTNEGFVSELNQPNLLQTNALLDQGRHQGMVTAAVRPFLGRDSAPIASLGTHYAARQMPSAVATMASPEVMRHQDLVVRERALRELQVQRAAIGYLPPAWLDGGQAPFPDGLWTGAPESAETLALTTMLARFRGVPPGPGGHPMPGPGPPSALGRPSLAATLPLVPAAPSAPPHASCVDPKRALRDFLDAFGADATSSRKRLSKAIEDTEESLAVIHDWDRAQGLRKCHSRTVVKTRGTRAQLKAFLAGEEPPRKPPKKRRKKDQ